MRERPILFSGEMVRAILAGKKTQTRRVMRVQPESPAVVADIDAEVAALSGKSEGPSRPVWAMWPGLSTDPAFAGQHVDKGVKCPYGRPGDRLWVRESWGYFGGDEYLYQQDRGCVGYRADWIGYASTPGGRWRPSIHMPRWASRITLEITRVRVERLTKISEADAKAEGVDPRRFRTPGVSDGFEHRLAYAQLWEELNAGRGHPWDSDPWVWVLDFSRAGSA
jgi:hypothetical protein